jgi:hypothetical protein
VQKFRQSHRLEVYEGQIKLFILVHDLHCHESGIKQKVKVIKEAFEENIFSKLETMLFLPLFSWPLQMKESRGNV